MPTPFDRNLGLKLASKSLNYMIHCLEGKEDYTIKSACSAVVIGMKRRQIAFTPVAELVLHSDFE